MRKTFSNFEIVDDIDEAYGTRHVYADVDMTEHRMFRAPVTRRVRVFKRDGYWHFLDSGEFTPGVAVEKLAWAFEARALLANKGG